MRLDVIVNARARRFAADRSAIDRMRRAAGARAELHVTSSLAELDSVARAIADRGADLVVLSGGDGTFMAGLTALARAFGEERLPRLALLPGGTVATVARNWGMAGAPDVLLAHIVEAPHLRFSLRPTLRVTEGDGVERLGFIFGTGLVARFFERYYASGAAGYAGAARIVARVFVESFWGGAFARSVLDPLPCTLLVDGAELRPKAWSLVCAAVVRDLGIHMLVTYRAGLDPTRPHLVASALGPGSLGPRAPFVIAGRRIGGADHFDDLVREFVVRFPDVGPYVLDGEVLRASSVRVTAGPAIAVVDPP